MAIQEEEVRAKLSLDTSTLGRAKREISEFSQHGHSGFVHVGTPARAFHKVMHEITEQSPIMGRALMIALNPTVGVLGAVAAGFGYAVEKLKEFNKHLDEMRDKNLKPITNAAGAAEAVSSRAMAVRSGSADFIRKMKDKNSPVLQGLDEMQTAVLEGMPPGAARDAVERSFLETSRHKLTAKAIGAESEKGAAEKNFGSARIQSALKHAQDVKKALEEKVGEMEKDKGNLQEAEGQMGMPWYTRPGQWRNILSIKWSRDVNQKEATEAGQKLDQLKRYKEELDKADKTIKQLTETDHHNNEELKRKQENLEKLIEAIKELDKAINKLPVVHPSTPGAPPSGPTIDPTTGGIAYRPLANRGGIAYRPLMGAPGYSPIAPTAPTSQAVDPLTLLNRNMARLVEAAVKDGVLFRVPD